MRRALLAVCVALTLCPNEAAAQGRRRPTVRPSNLLEELRRYKSRHPGVKAEALARYANALVARRGFDYNFDACEIFPRELRDGSGGPATGALHTFRRRLTRLDGRGLDFDLVADDFGSPCAECFLTLPARRVTKTEMHVVAAGGRAYGLKRPAVFMLDEASLVGPDLKTVLRTWQLPYQTIPSGVSPDGRRLYVGFYDDANLDELVLEISDDGRPNFRVKEEVAAGRGEWVVDHPKDPGDAYLSFVRFHSGGRAHVVRFSGPCT